MSSPESSSDAVSVSSWLFLVESLTVTIVVIFYLFYFNRVLGWAVATLCNLYLRRYNFNATVEFEAFQLSLLAGRILFKNVRYHSVNQSLRIVKGHVTCRYWYLRTQQMDLPEANPRDQPSNQNATLPHRWIVSFEGAEWFVYNRTAAFDVILERLGIPAPNCPDTDRFQPNETEANHDKQPLADSAASQTTFKIKPQNYDRVSTPVEPIDESLREESAMGWALQNALPIKIEGRVGVITVGNASTSSIFIVAFNKVDGIYSAPSARSRHDLFRQDFKFSFYDAKMVIRANPDFLRPLEAQGSAVLDKLKADPSHSKAFQKPITQLLQPTQFSFFAKHFEASTGRFFSWFCSKHNQEKKFLTSSLEGFLGLPRFLRANAPPYPTEYAKVTTILTANQMDFRYYVDSPGKVPADPLTLHHTTSTLAADHEDGLPPEYGIDIKLVGAQIIYGPWADRQRSCIQKSFFPAQRFDSSEVPEPSCPGARRAHTELVVKIMLEDGRLRIPIREPSKDWLWDSEQVPISTDPSITRTYGWLDLTLGSRSQIVMTQSQLAQSDGYQMAMHVKIFDLEVSSSVNKSAFIRVPMITINADMPTPLIWDAPRTWRYSISFSTPTHQTSPGSVHERRPQISLIRDHVQILTDLIKDWVSGPPTSPEEWIPTTYEFELKLLNYDLCLHLNDLNVIERFDLAEAGGDNYLLTLSGPLAKIQATIPGDRYRPPVSSTPFELIFDQLDVKVDYPTWSAQHSFATASATHCAELGRVVVAGTYDSNDDVKVDLVDFLSMTLEMEDVVFKAFGNLFRLMMNIKENYLGTYNHHTTPKDFILAFQNGKMGEILEEITFKDARSNLFEVELKILITNLLLAFPEDPFDCSEVILCAIPSSQGFFRNHNYFMELDLKVGPLLLQPVTTWEPYLQDGETRQRLLQGDFGVFPSRSYVRLEHLQLTTLRLFGPRPRGITYLGDWRLNLGRLSGEFAIEELGSLARVARNLKNGFVDSADSLLTNLSLPPEPDATFARFTTETIDLVFVAPRSRGRLHLSSGINVFFNDLSSDTFQSHLEATIPIFGLYLLVPDPRGDMNNPSIPWLEVASCTGNLELLTANAPLGWEKLADKQLDFLLDQDFTTKRCHFLYSKDSQPLVKHDLPFAAADILKGLDREDFHDPYGVIDPSDDEESIGDHRSGDRHGSDSSNEESETDDPRLASKISRRERRYGQRRSSLSTSRILNLEAQPIPAASYATALPSWRYYGFNSDVSPESPSFLPMRSGLFPPERASAYSTSSEYPIQSQVVKRSMKGSMQGTQAIGRQYIDIQMKTPLDIFCTPLCAEVTSDMIDTLVNDNLDTTNPVLINRIWGSLPFQSPGTPPSQSDEQVYEAFVHVPLVRIRILQDIFSSFGPSAFSSHQRGSSLLCAAALTIRDIKLDGKSDLLEFKGPLDALGLPKSMHAAIGGVRYFLRQDTRSLTDTLFLNTSLHPEIPSGTVLAWTSELAQLELSHDGRQSNWSINTSDFSFFFVEQAVETMAGSASSLQYHLTKLLGTVSHYNIGQRERTQQVILGWMRHDNGSVPLCLQQNPFWTHMAFKSNRTRFSWYCATRLRHIAYNRVDQWQPTSSASISETLMREQLATWSSEHGGDCDIGPLGALLPFKDTVIALPTSKPDAIWLQADHSFSFVMNSFVARFVHATYPSSTPFRDPSKTDLLRVPPTRILVATRYHNKRAAMMAHLNTGVFKSRIDPHLGSLAQHIMAVIDTLRLGSSKHANLPLSDEARLSTLSPSIPATWPNLFNSLQITVALGGGRLEAVADRLGVLFDHGRLVVSLSFKKQDGSSLIADSLTSYAAHLENIGLHFSEVAAENLYVSDLSLMDNLLITACVEGINASISASRSPGNPSTKIAILLSITTIRLGVRRSLVKLAEFVRDWRRQEVASRIVPIYHQFREAWKSESTHDVFEESELEMSISLEFYLATVCANFQPIPRLEVIYDLKQLSITDALLTVSSGKHHCLNAGLSLDSHVLSFTSTDEPVESGGRTSQCNQINSRGLLKLPSAQLMLSSQIRPTPSTHLDVTIGSFNIYLSIEWLDTIVAMSSRYGEDINQLVTLLRPQATDKSCPTAVPNAGNPIELYASVVLAPFEISFLGSKPMPRIECRRLRGSIHPRWRFVEFQEMTVALAPSSSSALKNTNLAKFAFDLILSNRHPEWALHNPPDAHESDAILVTADFQRIHAVAATSAFKLLLDCIQHLQSELQRVKTIRRAEMVEAEAHIEKVLTSKSQPGAESKPLLQRLIFAGRCSQFGLAIPLDDATAEDAKFSNLSADNLPSQDSARAALLISFTRLMTFSRLGQTAHASVELFAIQAVSQLDPSFTEHFESTSHQTRNSVSIPHLDVKFGLTTRPEAPTLFAVIASAPSGITIDISPSIVLIIYAFLDVYEEDYRLMMNVFDPQDSGTPTQSILTPPLPKAHSPKADLSPTITDPWAIRVEFDTGDGDGGRIQLHTFDLVEDDADFVATLQRANASLGRADVEVAHSDLFYLPGVSAWAVYNPIFGSDDASLHIDVLVHSSQNTLNPTLLRFVAQMSGAVDQRLKRRLPVSSPSSIKTQFLRPAAQPAPLNKSSILSTKLSFGLRIDQSELTVTCLPTRALAKVQWASGVLFASGQINRNEFNAACTISKISAFLRHEHGFDSALKAEAGDLAASLHWRALRPSTALHTHSCSLVVKFSELLTEVDFNHLDIFLLFKAIWLDQVTPTHSDSKSDPNKASLSKSGNSNNDTKVVLIAVLADNIKLLLRLSTGVGTVHLATAPMSLRIRHIPSISRSLRLDVGETNGAAFGDGLLGGRGTMQFFTFFINVEDLSSNTVLDIKAAIGPIQFNVAVASETILLLDTQLVEGNVQDDWTAIKSRSAEDTESAQISQSLGLRIALHIQSVNILTTLYTESRGKSLVDAIQAQINQQSVKAQAVLGQLPAGVIVKRQKATVSHVVQHLENRRTHRAAPSSLEIDMIGSLRLTSRNISVTLFAGQFGDMPLLQMRVKSTKVSLVRTPNTTNLLHNLDFTTEGCQARRINLPPNSLSEKDQSDGKWSNVLRNTPSELVFDANRLWISMLTSEVIGQKEVLHTYRAEMPNNIHISTDVTTHANLWSKFRSAWSKANESKAAAATLNSTDVEGAAGATQEELILIAQVPPMIEDAKVQELWHAALPLVNYFKWNENLPRYTLNWVIRPLDNLVDFFESVYESAFAQHQFKVPSSPTSSRN